MNLLQEYLIEQALNESLDTAYEYYREKLTREQFDKLIALDPTFRLEDDRVGTYGRWILTSFLRKTLTEDDMIYVEEILNDFHNRKRFLKAPFSKDIGSYKTIKEIRDALDSIELTAKQIAKQNRKMKKHVDLGEEAEFVLETDKWEVWTPKTLAASMKLGSGTQWCTASTSSGADYFPRYTSDWGKWRGYRDGEGAKTDCGVLYIFSNKKDPRDKYQLQVIFDASGNLKRAGDFMNIDDSRADLEVFIVEENLIDEISQTKLKDLPEVKSAIKVKGILSSGKLTVKNLDGFSGGHRSRIKLEDGTEISSGYLNAEGVNIKELTVIGNEMDTVDEEKLRDSKFETIIFSDKCTVTTIEESAFKNSKLLKKIVLPPKLVNIDLYAFKGCSALEEIFLPDTVTFIGYQAFEGANKVVIKLNKRTAKNTVRVPKQDIEFLKRHIQYLPQGEIKEPTGNEPVVEAFTVLNEVFSPTMPQWLKDFIAKKSFGDTSRPGNQLRIKMTGERFGDIEKRTIKDKQGVNYGFIDLKDATFISAPVPQNPRDPLLRDPYLPIFHLKYTDVRDNELIDEVYIPGVNDDDKLKWERGYEDRKPYGQTSKTSILQYTVDFCYIDLRVPSNFVTLQDKQARADAKKGSVDRLSRAEIKKEFETRGRTRTDVDKSGYELNPQILIDKLKKYNRENYAKAIKNIYARINVLRKELFKELSSLDVKSARYDEQEVKKAYDKLFSVIYKYREFKDNLDMILSIKDKKERELKLNSMFDVGGYISDNFEQLRMYVVDLEKKLKIIASDTLEGYPAYGIAVN